MEASISKQDPNELVIEMIGAFLWMFIEEYKTLGCVANPTLKYRPELDIYEIRRRFDEPQYLYLQLKWYSEHQLGVEPSDW